MKITIGCDLVCISTFTESVINGKQALLDRLFTPHEQSWAQTYESLAGIFAAKEAFLKASGMMCLAWIDIEVFKQQTGKPCMRVVGISQQLQIDVSISHDGDYAMASVLCVSHE
jgi:phosphopantetheine--protein transferase-like protein